MSSSNLVSVKYVAETTYDTVPTAGTWQYARFTGESLSATSDTTTSSEIRRDRSISDMPLVSITTSGSLDIEFSADSYDDLLESSLCSTWAADTPAVGSQQLKVGIIESSYTVEKHFEDISKFILYSGMRVGSANLSMAYGSILTGSFAFMGATASTPATTSVGGGTTTAASTTEVLNSTSDFGVLEIDGSESTICINSLNLTIDNSLRAITCIGSPYSSNQKLGTANVSGTMEVYLDADSFSLYEKALANTGISIMFSVADADSSYEFFVPNVKLSADSPAAGSLDSDTMLSLNFTALYDNTAESSLVITKVDV